MAAKLRASDMRFMTPEYEKARNAYKEKEYNKAIGIYEKLNFEELSEFDKKIYKYCQKKMTE